MNTTVFFEDRLHGLIETLKLYWRRPPRRQIGAFCYRLDSDGPKVLLITTRNARRWILPKGWPMIRRSGAQIAEREAFEEAGIIGITNPKPLGRFRSFKGLAKDFRVVTEVTVYPILVTGSAEKFPEVGKRQLVWLPLDQAIERCDEPGLRELFHSKEVRELLNS